MKRLVVLLFLMKVLVFSLSAEILYKKCDNENIHENAKGSYSIDTVNITNSRYVLNGKSYAVFENLPDYVNSKDLYFSFQSVQGFYTIDPYESNIKFDGEGNLWFLVNVLEKKSEIWNTLLCKYDPKLFNTEYTSIGNNAYATQFAVSDDGQWAVVRVCEERENKTGKGYNRSYLVHAGEAVTVELLLDDSYTYKHEMVEPSMCFDSSTRSFIFYNHGWSEMEETAVDRGLYELRIRGEKYYPGDLIRHSSLLLWRFSCFLEENKPKDGVTYSDLCKILKHYCCANADYDSLKVTLKYFNGLILNGVDFSDYYETDSSGNPLTEEAALKYILEKGEARLQELCWNYTEHYFNLGEGNINKHKLIPLELLVQNKKTGGSAVQADRNIYRHENTTEAMHVFYNDEGVWGLRNYEDGTKNSRITHVRDAEGNYIRNQISELDSVNPGGMYERELPLYVGKDYLLFMEADGSKVYYLSQNILTDVSEYCVKNKDGRFKMADFKEHHNEIDAAMKTLDVYNPGLVKTEYVYKTDSFLVKVLIIVSVLFVILAAAVVVMLLRFRKIEERRKYRSLKKDKKFVFDIQEKERGKISRDIHDSIIQDIRSIRLYSEMLKVDDESLEKKHKIISLATDSVVKLRNICYNLTPAELATHEDGDDSRIELVSIIQTLVTQFIEKTHIPCSIQIDENFIYPVFEKEVSQNLFRIIQESLTNIEKHSYATQCSIYIKSREEENRKYMVVYISDDGVGCNINSILSHRKKLHFGLQSMMERIDLIGGKLEFKSEMGDGMELIITVPVKE